MLNGWDIRKRVWLGVPGPSQRGRWHMYCSSFSSTSVGSICGLDTITYGFAWVMLFAISQTGRGVSGSLDVVEGGTRYPVLRRLSGFWIGVISYQYQHKQSKREAEAVQIL